MWLADMIQTLFLDQLRNPREPRPHICGQVFDL
jgi:hypothetical protein